jgi:hypothetical protein
MRQQDNSVDGRRPSQLNFVLFLNSSLRLCAPAFAQGYGGSAEANIDVMSEGGFAPLR